MAAKYWVYSEDIEKSKGPISSGQPVEMEVWDDEVKTWMRARVLISQQPLEGTEDVAVLGPFGDVDEKSGWRIKIEEEFPELLDEE